MSHSPQRPGRPLLLPTAHCRDARPPLRPRDEHRHYRRGAGKVSCVVAPFPWSVIPSPSFPPSLSPFLFRLALPLMRFPLRPFRFGRGEQDHFFPDISRGPCSVCPRNSCIHTTARFNSTGSAHTHAHTHTQAHVARENAPLHTCTHTHTVPHGP